MWRIEFKASAQRDLESLDPPVRRRVLKRIEGLAANPRPPGSLKMTGEPARWRLRVGDYRVVYQILDDVLIVTVIKVAHRKNAYRGQ
mgnify:CR=1 FL=1